ncbi:MAG: hypothetical protein R3F53_08705 [Gammaproteobacteria bacterium]
MRSITARLLIAASVVIVAFFGLTGLALDKAFRDSAYNAVRERLQAQVYMLLGAANMDAQQQLQLPKALPEVRFLVPDSGLYAMVLDHQGHTVWRSDSLLVSRCRRCHLPRPAATAISVWSTLRVGRIY